MKPTTYWEQRFTRDGKIWGEEPSLTIRHALELFRDGGVRDVLVPGCGYGRNALPLARQGFRVTGLDVSATALSWLKEADDGVRSIHGSALEVDLAGEQFDAIYGLNLLHLFLASQRELVIENCRRWLRPGGLAFFGVFADSDFSCGRGREVEPSTFESRPGRPAHYFTEQDLREHFSNFDILTTDLIAEPEDHPPDGPHVHSLRWIYARKPSDALALPNTSPCDGEAF